MKKNYLLLLCAPALMSCSQNNNFEERTISKEKNIEQFTAAMRRHIDAVERKDQATSIEKSTNASYNH